MKAIDTKGMLACTDRVRAEQISSSVLNSMYHDNCPDRMVLNNDDLFVRENEVWTAKCGLSAIDGLRRKLSLEAVFRHLLTTESVES